jgi:hypothetical protein
LLGRGPGLTPSGDDVLAGYLLGCRAFGVAAPTVRAAVLRLAPAATTVLSAALLRQAADGWCVPQVAALISALAASRPDPAATRAVLAVGASSGAALASGVLTAATRRTLGVAA